MSALGASPFAKIYAFYNHESTNNNHFQISNNIGGTGRLSISNPTNYNVELRSGGPTGDILGYIPAKMTSGTVLRLVAPKDYDLYLIFKFYNPSDNEIYSVVPVFNSGELQGKDYMYPLALTGTDSWNVNRIFEEGEFHLSTGGIYLRINNTSMVAMQFFLANTPQTTNTAVF